MRAVLTRVKHASVSVDGKVIGQIGEGFLVLLGVTHEDTEAQAEKLADKLTGLRIFEDENEKMNRSLADVGGQVLVVSGADMMDGTPVYDIKPYLPQFDAHPNARAGFTDTHEWRQLNVIIPEDIRQQLGETRCRQLSEILAEDPRPQYHDSPERVYGLPFDGYDIKFRVVNNSLIIIHIDLF